MGSCYRNGSAVEVMLRTTHPQHLGRYWLGIQLEPESTAESRRRLTSSDDDLDLEVLSFGHSVGERKVATLKVLDIVGRQLRLPLLLAVAVLVGIVLRRDDDASLVGRKVRNDITPTLVAVDTQRDDEVFASVGRETKGATRLATARHEHVGIVDFAPRSSVNVFSDHLLGDVEERILVGLEVSTVIV
jgi:hypothetical protein